MNQPKPKPRRRTKITKELKHLQSSKPYKDLIKNMNTLWFFTTLVIALITKVLQYSLISYTFFIIACVFLIQFLWRVIHPKLWKFLSISVVTILVCGWVAINGWKDIQKARGILFRPAKSDEVLIIVAEFDRRGGIGFDPATRIVKQLKSELKNVDIENTRIEIAPKIGDKKTARRMGKIHNALFVIWGWYDDVGFNPEFTITKESKQPLEKVELQEIPLELKEFNLYIRKGLPEQMAYLGTFTIGQLYFWQSEYEKALRAFNVALENLKRSSRIEGISSPKGMIILHFFRGNTHLHNDHFNDAIADYTKAIELDSTDAFAYNNRGIAYSRKGNFDQTIAELTKAIELDSTFADAYYNRGNAYWGKDSFDQAIADYTRTIGIDSTYIAAYNNRGIVYNINKDFAQAIDDFTKAIELDPTDIGTYNNRGNIYKSKGDFNKAIADYSKAIELDPTYAKAYSNRGNAYGDKDNFDRAIADYTKAIELDPTDADAYYNRGIVYNIKNDFAQAIDDYTKAIELDPTDATIYNNRGFAYISKGNLAQAIVDFTKAIELDPTDIVAYNNRGNVYKSKSDFDQAIADYTKAIELDSMYAVVYNNRGIVYNINKDFAQAIADFTKAIELDPTYVAYYNRGNAYKDKGNFEQAIVDYSRAIELDPTYAASYCNRGVAYAKKDLKVQAINDLQMYHRLVPDAPNRSEVKQLIDELKK